MRPRLCLIVAGLIVSGLLAGCQLASRPPYPHDPLLLSKKPNPEHAEPAKRVMLAAAEPDAPPFPAAAFAARNSEPLPTVPGRIASSHDSVPIVPAVRSRPRIEPAQTLAHATDYSWLQGILEKHYEGYFYLRFADPTADDPWGGKVRLDFDPRLGQYSDGDLVRVAGAIFPGAGPAKWDQSPHYQIRSIQLLRSSG